jgi:hypothetical protein
MAPNAVVPVTVRLAIDGVDIGARMRARMIYAEAPRSGGRFIDLTPGQTAFPALCRDLARPVGSAPSAPPPCSKRSPARPSASIRRKRLPSNRRAGPSAGRGGPLVRLAARPRRPE